jgi:serine protease Do
VIGTDPFTEIAVVKVSREGLPAANFVEDLDPAIGELVVAIGSPSGFQSTVTLGLISGLNREVPAQLTGGRQEAALVDLVQTDAAISPGSSGGALANADTEVIGITVAGIPAQTGAANIGFAIPSDTAISVTDQIIESGEVIHPYLGVSLTNLNPQVAERFGISVETGALVTGVDPNGPANEAGIGRETVITAVSSERIESAGDLLAALREYRPGDRVNLIVVEDGNEREVAVELGERR